MAKSLKSGILRNRFPQGETRDTELNVIAPEARERFPFFFKLPYESPLGLLKWRVYVRKRALVDHEFRKWVWQAAAKDKAFFAVTFGTIFEPRPDEDGAPPRWLPFFLWTDQVSVLAWLEECKGIRSTAVNKTRGLGLSWLAALFAFHDWLFLDEAKIGFVTKDKDLLDSPDANSLIGKVVYMYDALPAWAKLNPNGGPLLTRLVEKVVLLNTANKATIQGFVSTSHKLRSLRFTYLIADEFAFYERNDQEEWMVSSGGTTECRIFISTWNGFDDMFHRINYEEESSLLRINAFWENNPERWKGAYMMVNGVPVLVDKDYQHPPNYPFGEPDLIEDGMLRSPWVDAELSKPGIDRLKALRDIYGKKVADQTNSFFDRQTRAAIAPMIKDPDLQGILHTTGGKVHIIPTTRSNIRIWGNVPERDRGPYVIGCDLSQGVGASFSVCQVIDAGGEQVLEYGVNDLNITDFAFNVVALARWLAGDNGDGWVLIDAESGGGQQAKPFFAELLRLQYGNIHQSEIKTQVRRQNEAPEKYFGTLNRDAGLNNFIELQRAILSMETIVRSARIPDDMRVTSKDEDGKPSIPKNRKEGHGDFLHAYAVAWWRAFQEKIVSLENRAELDHNKPINLLHRERDFAMSGGNSLWSQDWMN